MAEVALNHKFAELFNAALREKGMTMKQLAALGKWQYEAFRKLSKGITTPSDDMLDYLHERLGMDKRKAELAVNEDKARRRGLWGVVAKAAHKNPELEPIDREWVDLTEHDKREIIALVQMKARFNREHRTGKHGHTKSPTKGERG